MIRNKFSLADQVFSRIEKDIIQGKYGRGDILSESEIAESLGVSRTPVREALNRLEQENMVEGTGKGIRVIGLSEKDIITMYKARELLEGMCIRESAAAITEEDLRKLEDIVEYTEFCIGKNQDAAKIRECDDQFHDTIYKASADPVLYNILIPLHKKVAKYRRLNLSDPSRADKSGKEHRMIFEALKAHDPDAAEKAAVAHVIKARQVIEKNASSGRTENG